MVDFKNRKTIINYNHFLNIYTFLNHVDLQLFNKKIKKINIYIKILT